MLDVLQVANGIVLGGGGSAVFSVRVATPSGADAVGFGGVPIVADASLAELTDVDVAVLPPVLDGLDESLAANADLIVWLKRRAAEGVLLTSVCTGAYFLAEAGVLDGRRATTYPGRAMSFRRRYPGVMLEPDRRIVDEGSVISAGATTSYLDLGALSSRGRYAGHAVAVVTAKVLAVDKNRVTQRPYFLFADQRDRTVTQAVLEVQDWIEEHHREERTTSDSSPARFAMSVRTLNRRFRAATGRDPGDLPPSRPDRSRQAPARRDDLHRRRDHYSGGVWRPPLLRPALPPPHRDVPARVPPAVRSAESRRPRTGMTGSAPETVHSDPAGLRANPGPYAREP